MTITRELKYWSQLSSINLWLSICKLSWRNSKDPIDWLGRVFSMEDFFGRANVGLLGRKVVGYFSEFISNDHFYRGSCGCYTQRVLGHDCGHNTWLGT